MSQENVEIVRTIYDEWGRGNLQAGVSHFDPRIMFIPYEGRPDGKSHYVGTKGIAEFMRTWLTEWTDFSITAEELADAGDSVVVAQRQRATGKTSGVQAELSFFAVWTFRGRAVIRMEHFRDRDAALEAAGLGSTDK